MQETKYTYCRICEPNCGLVATVEDGKLANITGDKEHPMSRGYICARGLATLDINRDPDRILYPQRRVGETWQRVSWDEALRDIGPRLAQIRKQYGRDSVAIYFGNPVAFDCAFSLYLQMAMMSLKTRNVFSAGSQDCNNKFVVSERVLGSPVLQPVPDIDNMDFLIILGSNPAVSKMSFVSLSRPEERLKAIEKRGGRVIIIDPRHTETAGLLGEHHFIKPDTDVFLLAAMLQVIITEKLFNPTIVKDCARGIEALSDFVQAFPPSSVASVTGIPSETIIALARDFARARNACLYSSVGLNMGSFGTLAYWLVHCINIITGRFDVKGSQLFPDGPMDMTRALKFANRIMPKNTSRIGNYPAVMGTMPAGIMADEILTPGEGQIKALIVLSGNPLLSVPDTTKLKKAFASLDLLVSIDLFANETAGMAHYVLPSTDMYEHWDMAMAGMMFNASNRFLNYTDAVVAPRGECRDLWVGLHEVMQAAGYHPMGIPPFSLISRPLDYIGRLFGRKHPLSFNPLVSVKLLLLIGGISWRKLKKSRQGLLLGEHQIGRFFKRRILTEDRKAELAPQEFISQRPILEAFLKEQESYTGLRLIGQRQRHTHNTWFHNVKSFVEKEGTTRVTMHPADAAKIGVENNDMVIVKSDTGSIRLPVNISDEVMPGIISIPHGWGHEEPSRLSVASAYPGVNVNVLMPSGPGTLDSFSGMAHLTGIRVTAAKA